MYVNKMYDFKKYFLPNNWKKLSVVLEAKKKNFLFIYSLNPDFVRTH